MKEYKGITLIALIITVIIMLILAGVALSAISGDAGLFGRAQKTAELYNNQVENETDIVNVIIDEINKYYNGDVEVTVKVGGETKILKKGEEKDLLGKVVTNFKTGSETTEPVTIGGETYTVSTKYRLYYIDFDGKYGEKGTIYLKADYPGDGIKYNYELQLDTTSSAEDSNVMLKDLNPGLYYEEEGEGIPLPNKQRNENEIPSSGNNNMQAVTWLTNTENWEEELKKNVNPEIIMDKDGKDGINYIVGAPSLEMMMDSYNTHYGLSGDEPDTKTPLEDNENKANRVKLFYKYPFPSEDGSSSNYGYGVGPSSKSAAKNGYYYWTNSDTVKTDSIDSMYYPGADNEYYWLASPSAYSSYYVMRVNGGYGGHVGRNDYNNKRRVLPASFS